MTLEYRLVSTIDEWSTAYEDAQASDFVIMGSNSGINDWNDETARQTVLSTTKRVSLTNHKWMMPFTLLGLTKIPEEHGEWAGRTALHILKGVNPSDIAVVSNRKWDIWLNEDIMSRAGVTLPKRLRYKAKKVNS